MKKSLYDVIRGPVLSEKATRESSNLNQYAFRVATRANKVDVKRAVEEIYNVVVERVNILNVKGKLRKVGVRRNAGKTGAWKKAIVRVKEGQKIEII